MKKLFVQSFFLSASIIIFFIACTRPNPEPYMDYSGNWVWKNKMDCPARNGASSWVIGDTGYIVTGYNSDSDSCLPDLWQFDPGPNTWSQKANLPGAARQYGAAFVVGNNGYITSGYNTKTNQALQDCWQYDPATNSWKKMADLPDLNGPGTGARYDAVGFAVGNYGYIGTGYNGNYLNDFWKLDPAANQWSPVPNSPVNKKSGAVAFVYLNKAYICTGINNGILQNDFWQYDPLIGWTQLRDIANTSNDVYDDDYTDIARYHAVAITNTLSPARFIITLGLAGAPIKKSLEYDITVYAWERKTTYERSERSEAVGWSFSRLKRAFIGSGKNFAGQSLNDYDEWFPDNIYNPND